MAEPSSALSWNPSSWRDKPIKQVPAYPDSAALAAVEAKLKTIMACRRLGWSPCDDNAADALALWHYQATVFEPLLSLQTHPLFRRQQ